MDMMAQSDASTDLVQIDAAHEDMHVPDDPERVTLAQGSLHGEIQGEVVAFKGIPYAAPPVGELRFKPPGVVDPWVGERDATSWPAPCTQLDRSDGTPMGQEDCLYLNLWRPLESSDAPVIVFIHGGGNMFGSTSEQGSGVYTYEGATLAQRTGAVVVTLQYRLNTLGYMSLSELDAEHGETSGNWGLRDQVAALEWVQAHIDKFGGDASQVLLFGESGGASSVCGLVATPNAAGLFGAAIMQSGGCGGQPLSNVRSWSQDVVAGVGCEGAEDVLTCLRGVDAPELARISSQGGTTNQGLAQTFAGPMIDGVMLPNSPIIMMRRGEHNKVPLVFGANADETASPLFGIVGQTWTTELYEQRVRLLFGEHADAVLDVYSVGPDGAFGFPIVALIALTTDLQFICPTRTYARAATAGQSEPVYRFLFTHTLATRPGSLLGAFHGLELIYNFQHMSDIDDYLATPDDLYVEDVMRSLWLAFAVTGKPSTYDGINWPVYDEATDPYLLLGSPLTTAQGLRTDRCDFLESL